MPALYHIVTIADGDEGKDLLGTDVCDGRHCCLPSQGTEPADKVGKLFLVLSRREFGAPVVLP